MLGCSLVSHVPHPYLSADAFVLSSSLNRQVLSEALPWTLCFLPMCCVEFWLPASLITPELAVWP